MAEEIKITVRQENQGSAISDAEKQMKALKKEAEEYAKAGAPKAAAAGMKQHDAIGRADQKLQFQANEDTKREAVSVRAGGDTAGADELDKEVALRTLSLQLQKSQGIYESEATALAAEQIAAQEKIAAAKKAEAEAAKAAAAAEKEQAAAAKAAAVNDKKSQAAEEAAAKKEAAKAAKEEADATKQRKKDEDEILRTKKQQQAEAEKKEKAEKKAVEQQEKAAATAAKREVAEAKLVLRNALHEGAGQAGIPLGPLGNIGAMGPMALVATAIAGFIGMKLSQAMEKRESIAAEAGRGIESANVRKRIEGESGALAEDDASANIQKNKAELQAALDARGKFTDTDGYKDAFKRAFPSLGETSSKIAARKNEQLISRLEEEKPLSGAQALEKFRAGPGGEELAATKAENAGDTRSAWLIREKIKAEREYAEIIKKVGDTKEGRALAEEAANETIKGDERKRGLAIAGRMVNARSSGSDIARAARFAGGDVQSVADITAKLDQIHNTMQVHQYQALNHRPARNFRQ